MASSFPGGFDNFTDPLANSPLNSPSHATLHADVNDAVEKIETYMGLVKVIPTGATNGTVDVNGTVTIGNAVSSVTITNAFSNLYHSYKIILVGGTGSSATILNFQLSGSTTGYYNSRNIVRYPDGFLSGGNVNNGAAWSGVGVTGSIGTSMEMEIFNPFEASPTFMRHAYLAMLTSDFAGAGGGFHNVSTSYASFILSPAAGTLTGGKIRIYGYRN